VRSSRRPKTPSGMPHLCHNIFDHSTKQIINVVPIVTKLLDV